MGGKAETKMLYVFPLLLKPWKMTGEWEFGHLLEVMHILEQS